MSLLFKSEKHNYFVEKCHWSLVSNRNNRSANLLPTFLKKAFPVDYQVFLSMLQ